MSDRSAPRPGIEEYAEWIGRVLRQAFFPLERREGAVLEAPVSVPLWYESLSDADRVSAARILTLYHEMRDLAEDMTHENSILTVKKYDDLIDRFDQFMTLLNRFEETGDVKAGGRIDPVTGLRSEVGMYDDLMRELERRNRKGTPFAVTVCSIDHFADYAAQNPEENAHAVIQHLARLLKNTLRTFDDIYHLGQGEFVLCLKDTEAVDAYLVTDRLCELVREKPVSLPGGGEAAITISCGVSEPLPGDEGADITASAYKALKEAQGMGGDKCMQYEEVSPLMRFARKTQDP